MKEPGFIHLRTHSEYSLLEGALRLSDMPALCHERMMPALALTDTNSLSGALEFSESMSREGIQPIIGIELDCNLDPANANSSAHPGEHANNARLDAPIRGGGADKHPFVGPLILLAQNEKGYANLLRLASHLYTNDPGQRSLPGLDELSRLNEGIIALTGGAMGSAARLIANKKRADARNLLSRLKEIFPNRLYVEIERHRGEDGPGPEAELASEAGLIELAYTLELPLVATNNVLFDRPEMFDAQDVLICIKDGSYVDQRAERRRFTSAHYFKSAKEMQALFADIPEAIANTIEIAKRCAIKAEKRDPILPKFADNEVSELQALARQGLKDRLASIEHSGSPEEYSVRLEYELGVIEKMGFAGYFLIVADFVGWARAQGIPVGPGRGSGAGSLVAFALTITDLDPLRFSLLFERFLNPMRISMPDFDIDFCADRRGEVMRYVREKYGAERVAGIITFGALLSKAAIRDVGRVLQIPYSQADRLAKLIPVEGVKPLSIIDARKAEPRLDEEARAEPVIARLLDISEQVEGLYRNASTHAAGIVIADRPLVELVPLYQDPRSFMPATGFSMKWSEAAGLVKFDFLGLKSLTIIQNTLDLLSKQGIEVDINTIPLDDEASYDLYASANTVGVFQVESTGMRDALRQLKPDCIEDIVALVALYRPGPMENIPRFCKVKNGLAAREYIHPLIDDILDETQGIIVYQEQVMEIAQKMAGYSLGEADNLRRAMGKKIPEEMARERPKFVEGAKKKGVEERLASEVFDLLEKFANYGFNKSHAAAYALVSFQTAYLKANYPVEFMAAVMNSDIHNTDKLAIFKSELDKMGIEVKAPSVNSSMARFDVEGGAVIYALGALKNVGLEAMSLIAEGRGEDQEGGGAEGGTKPGGNPQSAPYKDIFDLARRVDLRRVGKRPLEMLARAGALDELEEDRAKLLANIDLLTNYSALNQDEQASSQQSLFGGEDSALPPPRLVSAQAMLPAEKLAEEHLAFGYYFSGHPLDSYRDVLKRHQIKPLAEIAERAEREGFSARIAGTVAARQERKSARGGRYAFLAISDPSAGFEVMVFSELLDKHRDLMEPGQNVVLNVEISKNGDQSRALLRGIMPIDGLDFDRSRALVEIRLADEEAIERVAAIFSKLEGDQSPGKGRRGELRAVLALEGGNVTMRLGENLPLGAEVQAALASCPGVLECEVM